MNVHNVGDKASRESNTTVEGDSCLNILYASETSVVTVELLDDVLDHFLVRHCTHSDTRAMKTKRLATPFNGRASGVNKTQGGPNFKE